MDLSIVGSGYVGTRIAACLADAGHHVTNVDIDDKIVTQLNAEDAPIHEPGLAELLAAHGGDRLQATTDYAAVRDTDVTFLALPTPSNDDGSINLDIIEMSTQALGEALAPKDEPHVVVVKSTVIPGTTEETLGPILAEAAGKLLGDDFHLAMNPEFLREGSAVADFQYPDKVVFGTETELAREQL